MLFLFKNQKCSDGVELRIERYSERERERVGMKNTVVSSGFTT